jgi:hypothetical protein
MWAVESVACPQSFSSSVGVNQRRVYSDSVGDEDLGTAKAVSARLISLSNRRDENRIPIMEHGHGDGMNVPCDLLHHIWAERLGGNDNTSGIAHEGAFGEGVHEIVFECASGGHRLNVLLRPSED